MFRLAADNTIEARDTTAAECPGLHCWSCRAESCRAEDVTLLRMQIFKQQASRLQEIWSPDNSIVCPTEKPTCTHKFILSNKAGKVTAEAGVQCNAIHKKIFPIALPLQYLVRISWARFSEKKARDSHHQVARLTQLNNNATHITFCPAQICTNIQTTYYYTTY